MTGTKSTVLAFITINCRAVGVTAATGRHADVTAAVIWIPVCQRTPVVVVVIVLALVVAVVERDGTAAVMPTAIAQPARFGIGHMEFTNAAANVLRAVNANRMRFDGTFADVRENVVDIVDGHGYWPALQCC